MIYFSEVIFPLQHKLHPFLSRISIRQQSKWTNNSHSKFLLKDSSSMPQLKTKTQTNITSNNNSNNPKPSSSNSSNSLKQTL